MPTVTIAVDASVLPVVSILSFIDGQALVKHWSSIGQALVKHPSQAVDPPEVLALGLVAGAREWMVTI